MLKAMVVMAWPWGAGLPAAGPILFFLAAAGWFVFCTLVGVGQRAMNVYHAAMMLAMAWMYTVMSGAILGYVADGVDPGIGHDGHHGGHAMPDVETSTGWVSAWIAGLNWLCAIGFAVAALWWIYMCCARGRVQPAIPVLGTACQAMIAAGMSIMFAVMLYGQTVRELSMSIGG